MEAKQATKHFKRKRRSCQECGAKVYNLSQHTKTCQGTVLKNQASQVAGLRKGTSKAARRTRAATQVTALPRLLRVDDAGALARLHPKKLWTQPWSVRGWAVPPVITSTDPVASRVGVLKTLRRLIPTERRPRVKVYTLPPGEYEVEPTWNDPENSRVINYYRRY